MTNLINICLIIFWHTIEQNIGILKVYKCTPQYLKPFTLYQTSFMKFLFSALFTLTVIIAFSCKKPQSFDYRDIRNFKVNNLGFDKSKVSMDLVYFNPNNFGVNLKNVDCDIYLDNTYVGKFLLDTLMHIPRNAEFILPANMDVDMRNIFKNTFNVLFSREVLIGAKGTTRVGKGGVFVTIPFNYEGRHKVEL